MQKNKNIQTGLTYGVLIGLIYCVIAFARWSMATNLILFAVMAFLGYLVVLGLMFWEAYQRRKMQPDGLIDLKNLFQTLFVSVLIFELLYGLYNFIHLKFIDPNIIEKMKEGMTVMMEKTGAQVSDEQREQSLARFDDMKKAMEPLQVFKSYLINIAISGFFAFIISLIMRKKNPNSGMPQSM